MDDDGLYSLNINGDNNTKLNSLPGCINALKGEHSPIQIIVLCRTNNINND